MPSFLLPKVNFLILLLFHRKLVSDEKLCLIVSTENHILTYNSGWFKFRYMSWMFYINLSGKGISLYRFSVGASLSCNKVFHGLNNFCGSGTGVVIGGQGKDLSILDFNCLISSSFYFFFSFFLLINLCNDDTFAL